MTFKQILRKVFLIDFLEGFAITGPYTFQKVYTEQYPKVPAKVAPRYHGAPRLNRDAETGKTLCIACDLCAQACPLGLIEVKREKNPETKRWELRDYTYNVARCMFCNLCVEACPTNALELTQTFEYAVYDIQQLYWDQQALEQGPAITLFTK
jgi:NADH-quinone oxidoreductase subunit I